MDKFYNYRASESETHKNLNYKLQATQDLYAQYRQRI